MLAPIALFTYNRLEETKQTIEALQKNFLANESVLFIFSDGYKNEESKNKVDSVRNYIHNINGFKNVNVFESEKNKGLADSIINGVSQVLKDFENVIVLEDDLITSPNFLDFMNQALCFYNNDNSVCSISGYTMNLKSLKNLSKDFYFGYRSSSWGWATWKNVWESVDWDVTGYNDFMKSKKRKQNFNIGGSDMTAMLKAQMNGKIDSWAIRFCYQQFLNKQACVFPQVSKIQSIGFSKEATHTNGARKFIAKIDESLRRSFNFENFIAYDNILVKEFYKKFSIKQRVFDRIMRFYYG
jgi:hypothetical protein